MVDLLYKNLENILNNIVCEYKAIGYNFSYSYNFRLNNRIVYVKLESLDFMDRDIKSAICSRIKNSVQDYLDIVCYCNF